jgi:tetratricopeptide (TPR) repeat protein
MRFDPQANFVPADAKVRPLTAGPMAADHLPPGASVRSPLKTAFIILTLGFVGGAGYWFWSEGIPGVEKKATAETPVNSAVVQYAEALINGDVEAELLAAAGVSPPESGTRQPTGRAIRSRVRQEYDAGQKLMAMGQHDKAVPHFAEAVRLDPTYAEGHYRLGLAYVQSGDIKAAKHTLADLAKLDSDLANLLAHLIHK